VVDLEVCGYAFRTKATFVDWKVVARFDADHVISFDEEIHAALNSAIRAMCRHNAIDHTICAPPIVWCVVKMRPIRLNDLIQMFDSTHNLFNLLLDTVSTVRGSGWVGSRSKYRILRTDPSATADGTDCVQAALLDRVSTGSGSDLVNDGIKC